MFEGPVYRTEKGPQLDWTGPLCNRTFGPVALGLDQLQLQLREDCKTGQTDKKPVATSYTLECWLQWIALFCSFKMTQKSRKSVENRQSYDRN